MIKATVTYVETWQRKVEVKINEDEIREWLVADDDNDPVSSRFTGEIIGRHVVEFLNASREDHTWVKIGHPGSFHDDEFVDVIIERAEIIPVVKQT